MDVGFSGGLDAGLDHGAGGLDGDLSHDGTGLGLHGCDYGFGIGGIDFCSIMSAVELAAAPDASAPMSALHGSDDGMTFGGHVLLHRHLDTKSVFKEIAASMGLCEMPPHWVSVPALDKEEHKLLPLTAWSRNAAPGAMPKGFYSGATGSTLLFRRHWQLGKKAMPWSTPRWDRTILARIDMVCISWLYRETGDCETMFQLRVVPKMCPVRKIVPVDCSTADRHTRAAERTAKLMQDAYKDALPQPSSQRLRAAKTVRPRRQAPVLAVTRPREVVATSGADLDSALPRRPLVAVRPAVAAIVATSVPVRPRPQPVRVVVELPVAEPVLA